MPNQTRPTKLGLPTKHTGEEPFDELQRRIQSALDLLNRVPFLANGRMLSCRFPASSTDYAFEHGLGVPAACIVVRQNYENGNAAVVAESTPATQALTPQNVALSLRASAAGTFDIWFYPRVSKLVDRNRTPQQSR